MEVFLITSAQSAHGNSLLHARGGVSAGFVLLVVQNPSSPRSWRCFLDFYPLLCVHLVFSTLVEVFLKMGGYMTEWLSLLHARGGVSGSRC